MAFINTVCAGGRRQSDIGPNLRRLFRNFYCKRDIPNTQDIVRAANPLLTLIFFSETIYFFYKILRVKFPLTGLLITINPTINLLKYNGYVMHQQRKIQQLYALPTLYLCVLYLSENKHRLVPLTA